MKPLVAFLLLVSFVCCGQDTSDITNKVTEIHNLVCPKDDIEDLWQSWGQPDICRLPYGQVRICCGGVPGLPGRVLRWLSPRLNKPAVTYQRPPEKSYECSH
jgi:hypothetical protein